MRNLLIILILSSCTQIKKNEYNGEIVLPHRFFKNKTDLNKLDYRGHLYKGRKVLEGVAITHSFYCKCKI